MIKVIIEYIDLPFMIWYGDDTTYSHKDGDPYHAPQNNVQAVACGDGPVRSNKEAYYWNNETGWQACDQNGLEDYKRMYVGPKAILYGRTIRNQDYWRIKKKAEEEWRTRAS